MTKPKLTESILAAERFIALAYQLRRASHGEHVDVGTRLSGATRRASMDLTRALADLRRSSR